MERRLLLVFALTFLVIMLFQPLMKKFGPPQPAKPEISQAAVQNPSPALSPSPAQPFMPSSAGKTTARSKTASPQTAAALQVATTESETVIENDLYHIVFTNRGGRVKSWVLKKFTDDTGKPLELVNAAASEK